MSSNWTMETLQSLRGEDVYRTDGEKVGTIQEIYYDEASSTPEWIGLGTGFFGTKRRVVPVSAIQAETDRLIVPFTKDKIHNEPDFDFDQGMTAEEERLLWDYFSLGTYEEHSPRLLRPDERYRGGF